MTGQAGTAPAIDAHKNVAAIAKATVRGLISKLTQNGMSVSVLVIQRSAACEAASPIAAPMAQMTSTSTKI